MAGKLLMWMEKAHKTQKYRKEEKKTREKVFFLTDNEKKKKTSFSPLFSVLLPHILTWSEKKYILSNSDQRIWLLKGFLNTNIILSHGFWKKWDFTVIPKCYNRQFLVKRVLIFLFNLNWVKADVFTHKYEVLGSLLIRSRAKTHQH